MTSLQRAPSQYNHERDTQFEEYMARRGSYNGKADVEAAMGAEFGWSGSGANSPEEEALVSSGTVAHRPEQRASRSSSRVSEHILVSVPEEEEEGTLDKAASERLLGQKRRRSAADLDGPRVPQNVDAIEYK
jgi:hypothetical protein